MSARVYKLGGLALEEPSLVSALAREVSSTRAVVVHGGGRRVDGLLEQLGIASRFVDGRRETSAAAMEVVEMVLSGAVNKSLASALTAAGAPAVGLSGRDAGLLRARPVANLGCVGTPERARTEVLEALWAGGFVPVVSPVCDGPSGEALNVNADEAALGLARALGAGALVYLSDVDGVRIGGEVLDSLDADRAERLIHEGAITGGMAMKVRTALLAARAGIDEVVIAGRARLLGNFPGTRFVSAEAQA